MNADQSIRDDFDKLIKRESIIKNIKSELTYQEMEDQANIYSFFLFTGYLKVVRAVEGINNYELKIPNEEARIIYEVKFKERFNQIVNENRMSFYDALIDGDTKLAQSIMNNILSTSISYFDAQENFYHGFTLGLLAQHNPKSNLESGEGRFDIAVIPSNPIDKGIVIECKRVMKEEELI